MRLGALLLSAGLLPAVPPQAPPEARVRSLPWEVHRSLPPWTARPEEEAAEPPPLAPVQGGRRERTVVLSRDGSLRLLDRRGRILLRLGLPGRILRLYRDGGVEVDPGTGRLDFPAPTPLSGGAAGLPWGAEDFRPGLAGLLWIVDEGERVLTVVHPATAQVQYLALPPLSEPDLRFHPDRLELVERGGAFEGRSSRRRWGLPWTGLLPQLLELAKPRPGVRQGTAFEPFPKD